MKYDCVVVGAGMSGIVAATRLVTEGKKILLLEKESRPGGYFSGFENEDGDKFDYAISYVLSCGEGDVVWEYLKKLGLEDKITFKKLAKTDDIVIGDRHFAFGEGRENFLEVLYKEFPDSKDEIDDLMNWLVDYQEGVAVQGSKAMKFFMNYFRKDFEEFLDTRIHNELLKGILSLRIQAEPASLMIMAGFIVECYFKGMYYPECGSLNFVNRLISYLEEKGGTFLPNKEVVRFHTNNGKVVSAETKDGEVFEADYFVFNGDVIRMNKDMLEGERKDITLKQLQNRVVGHSSLGIFCTVKDMDLSRFKCGRVYVTESEKIFDTYRLVENNKNPEFPVVKLHFPCVYDETLTKDGRHIIRIETDIYYDETKDTDERYDKLAERVLDIVEKKLLPGLRDHIVYRRIINPLEWARMFGHTHGSGTGWAHTTYNMMVAKFPQNTEYPNLYIAGQWGEFGSGLRQLVLSGEKSAEYILRKE